ncbi:GtrA family protein [Blastococcus sp. SYSU D00820]
MTCPTLLRRDAVGEHVGDLVARVRADDTLGQFARFVLVGGTTSALYGLLFITLHGLGEVPANLIGAALTSALANEWHRRLTFRAEGRVHWLTAQWEGGALAVTGMIATSLALSWLTATTGTDDPVVQFALVAAVTVTIGCLRFLALRWAFRPRAGQPG